MKTTLLSPLCVHLLWLVDILYLELDYFVLIQSDYNASPRNKDLYEEWL
jgi:hypothetical protein